MSGDQLQINVQPQALPLRNSLGAVDKIVGAQQYCSAPPVGFKSQPSSASQSADYTNYAMGPPEVSFCSSEFSYLLLIISVVVVFVLLGSIMATVYTYGVLTTFVCTAAILWSIHMAGICASWRWFMAHAMSAPNS